ncbi:MAG: protein kinase [Gemmatimonadaceae bacterium]|nr:protein kinase [Gemmatimonadaceae bacterium]
MTDRPMLAERLTAALADRYRLDTELGVGGMATVYRAHDLKHDRAVAIKVLRPELANAVGAERFQREIQLAARLSHPHILPLFDSGGVGDTLYYVMPVVRGESLRDRLDREKQLPVADAVRLAREVAAALEHAHAQGVVHRDIKPENILLQDGHALLMDFGIGKALSEVATDTITQVGMTVGTPAYMSPEQAVGDHVDGRSDLYSLACVLYELLVGEPPFTGATVQAVIAKRFVQTPADVTALREGVPRAVGKALQQALQRSPIDRPAIADWLQQLGTATTAEVAARSAPPRSIAVLPFTNLSPDPENAYLGDGIAEDIIGLLSRVEGLHVAAKISAFSFKGKQVDLRTIGEALNVSAVLEGSVRKAGNRVRITVQLMSVADDYQLWSDRYDRELVDVFALQDEIATAIAERLQLTLVPREAPPAKATTREVEVYELCVRARALITQRGFAVYEAVRVLERALEVAPEDPTALGLMAAASRLQFQQGVDRTDVLLPRAMAFAKRAYAIAPTNPEALVAYGGMLTFESIRNRVEAGRLFREALAIDPRYSEARTLYAGWILIMGGDGAQDDEGAAELRRATVEDPRNVAVLGISAALLALIGAHEEALALARRALEVDPTAFVAHWTAGFVAHWSGATQFGLDVLIPRIDRFGRNPWLVHTLCGLYVQAGDRARAEAAYAELQARAQLQLIPSYSLACCATYLGRIDEAMDHAFESVRKRDAINSFAFHRHPGLEPIFAHPRYPELRALM